MAETATFDLSKTGSENITFKSSEGVPVRFSDAFLVGGTPEVFLLAFYQQEFGGMHGSIKDYTEEKPEATCFARIALTPLGYLRLLKSMAERVGLVLANQPEQPNQEEQK